MPSIYPTLSLFLRLTACLTVLLSLGGCTGADWKKALAGPHLEVSYDDLGTPAMLGPVLGPRGENPAIMVHSGANNATTQPRRLNAYNGMLLLRHNEHLLPRTPENEPLRQRMTRAYSRIYQYYSTRRSAALAAPPAVGRGAMGRMQMMPPARPTL